MESINDEFSDTVLPQPYQITGPVTATMELVKNLLDSFVLFYMQTLTQPDNVYATQQMKGSNATV